MDLSHKIALVTGAAGRIGKAIALSLAKEGATVAIHYNHSKEQAQSTLAIIQQDSPQSFLVQGDLSSVDAIETIAREATKFGNIDILINNASLFPAEDNLFTFQIDQWQRLWNVNVLAPMLLARNLFSDLGKSDTAVESEPMSDTSIQPSPQRVIVNLIDAGLNHISYDNFVYRMTKAALKEMTLMMAKELAPDVRVNGVAPGAILPPAKMGTDGNIMAPDGKRADDFFQAYVQKNVALKRPGSPEIIAENVLHLIQQDFLTGVILPVDGGEFI